MEIYRYSSSPYSVARGCSYVDIYRCMRSVRVTSNACIGERANECLCVAMAVFEMRERIA